MVCGPGSDDSVINLSLRGTECQKRGLHSEPIRLSHKIAVFRQRLKPRFPSLQPSFAVQLHLDPSLTCWLWGLRKIIPSRLHSSLTLSHLDMNLVLNEAD